MRAKRKLGLRGAVWAGDFSSLGAFGVRGSTRRWEVQGGSTRREAGVDRAGVVVETCARVFCLPPDGSSRFLAPDVWCWGVRVLAEWRGPFAED